MSQATIGQWGKDLAVRFPADVAEAAGFGNGERVEVRVEAQAVVIRKLVPRPSIEDLFRGRPSEEWRDFYADVHDWGPDLGREIVEG